jgi:hypothetical protein
VSAQYDAALVIGIKHYPALRSLQGAAADARRFASWLVDRAGLPPANVRLVTGEEAAPGRPVLQEINDAFTYIFQLAQAWPAARRLYMYFAGHGCSQEIQHLALLMANADPGNLNRAMNATEYRLALRRRTFREQLFLFDCCRQFDLLVRGQIPEWTVQPGAPAVDGLVQISLYAAGFTEIANERHMRYSERRGLFTEALMEGLEGAASTDDPRHGGVVTTGRLIPYMKDRITELSRHENLRQEMECEQFGGTAGPIILATEVPPWRRPVVVNAPPGRERIVVRDEAARVVHDVPLAGSTVTLDLELTSYTLCAEPGGEDIVVRVLRSGPDRVSLP